MTFREWFRVWAVRARLVTGWGQTELCDGGTAVDIADDIAQATVYTATVNATYSTLAKTIGTRRRYCRGGRAVGQAHKDRRGDSGESEQEEAVGGRGVSVVGECDG